MDQAAIDSLLPNDQMLISLDHDVWLMDDHRWAFYTWRKFALERHAGKFCLVHADYHWDAADDFNDSGEAPDEEAIAELLAADLLQLRQMTLDNVQIRYDSFIAPAIISGLISEVHFLCKQTDSDEGLNPELLASANVQQYIHDSPADLLRTPLPDPIIFDLCLDLFNHEENTKRLGEGDLWPDTDIVAWLDSMRPVIERAALVTVSLSFDYSGTEEDTRHLAALVLPRLQEWRSFANSP